MVMYSLLTDGGSLNVLAVHIDVARLAANHAAHPGPPDPDWCSALVAGSSRLVLMEYIRMILIYKFAIWGAETSKIPDENNI